MESTYSHLGICVSDLDRSLRFSCDALGFEKAESHAIGGTPLAFAYCTDPGGVRIELMDLGA